MSPWRAVLADVLVIAGTAALTLSIVAVVRIPDTYVKVHATSKAVVLGVLVILASSVVTGQPDLIARSLLVGVFLLPTAAVGARALVRLEAQLQGQLELSDEAPPLDGADPLDARDEPVPGPDPDDDHER